MLANPTQPNPTQPNPTSWRDRLALLARGILLLICCAAGLRAQQNDRVIHLWVDPRYGDNYLAWTSNPVLGAPNSFCSGAKPPHPLLAFDTTQSGTPPLLHASMPFRTVTSALQYLQQGIQQATQGASPYLAGQYTSAYVIIHCLPGLYQEVEPQDSRDPHNRLLGNGETFPIRLPNRVSIQGTSALNTIFEPLKGRGPVFELGTASWNLGKAASDPDQAWSYIDSVSISSTLWINDTGQQAPTPREQSGVFVGAIPGQRVFLNVSNCFLYCNGIGVLVDSPYYGPAPGNEPPEAERHQINLINNTFAWNLIGVWSGQLGAGVGSVAIPSQSGTGPVSRGFAHVSCINNIFDSTPPLSGDSSAGPMGFEVPMQNQQPGCPQKSLPRGMRRWANLVQSPASIVVQPNNFTLWFPRAHGMSNFEGLDENDLWIQVPGQASVDTNAYENTRFNRAVGSSINDPGFESNRSTFFPALPFTQPDWPQTSILTYPAKDLTIYTGGFAFTQPRSAVFMNLRVRGAVYVRDSLHLGGWAAGGPYFRTCDFDQSPADFRLTPTPLSWLASLLPVPRQMPAVNFAGHILVDAGFPNPAAQAWPAVMDNSGLSPGVQVSVPCRPLPNVPSYPAPIGPWEFCCQGFGNPRVVAGPTDGAAQRVDIGADELDLNRVAGYRAGTTSFMTAGPEQNQPLWPLIDNDYLWFLGTQPPGAPPPWEVGKPTHALWDPVGYTVARLPGSPLYLPTYVDTVPHLLPDQHPYWFYTINPNLFPTNWVWEMCAPQPYINHFLFQDPSVGIANPTGSTRLLGNPDYNWVDDPQNHSLPSGTPVYLTVWPQIPPQPPAVFAYDPLTGFGAFSEPFGPPDRPSQHPRMASAPSGSAMRFSLEFPRLSAPLLVRQGSGQYLKVDRKSNLQSFLVIRLP